MHQFREQRSVASGERQIRTLAAAARVARFHAVVRRLLLVAVVMASGCDDDPVTEAAPYEWDVPKGFPHPRVPADNPMNEAKVELGRRLFYDERLSGNETDRRVVGRAPLVGLAGPLVVFLDVHGIGGAIFGCGRVARSEGKAKTSDWDETVHRGDS